jgi:hypothetical protein
MNCKFIERGWLGYAIDIVTAGGFTIYRTFEYTKCIQKQNGETLDEIKHRLVNRNELTPEYDDRRANEGR